MQVGCLYKIKNRSWLFFPSKELAIVICDSCKNMDYNGVRRYWNPFSYKKIDAEFKCKLWGSRFDCKLTNFSENQLFVLLEEEAEYKRILLIDGQIGWIVIKEENEKFFEEK